VSDIDTALVDSLKVLDPKRPIREAGIGSQNPAQMPLAPDDDMIHTLAPDWSDQPFGKTVLPRRCWCDGFIAYAHSANSAYGDVAIDTILIPDEVAWCLVPGETPRSAGVQSIQPSDLL